jgi:thiol-disulfide isomerase/thioredoxin
MLTTVFPIIIKKAIPKDKLPMNLSEIKTKTVSINHYINSIEQPFRKKFLTRKRTYMPNKGAINYLKKFANDYVIVVFSAEWCKDCAANIPVLALISEATRLEVRIFRGLKKDPLSRTRKWRIPPSPPEVETFHVDKIPLIILFDMEGREIGRIIENPSREPILEEELLRIILEKHQ